MYRKDPVTALYSSTHETAVRRGAAASGTPGLVRSLLWEPYPPYPYAPHLTTRPRRRTWKMTGSSVIVLCRPLLPTTTMEEPVVPTESARSQPMDPFVRKSTWASSLSRLFISCKPHCRLPVTRTNYVINKLKERIEVGVRCQVPMFKYSI